MPHVRLAALVLAVTSLAAAGCGGSTSKPSTAAVTSTPTGVSNTVETQPSAPVVGKGKPLTRAALIARGDAICRHLNLLLASPSLTDYSLHTVGTTSIPEVRYYRAALAEMSALTPPPAMASAWKAILADMQRIPGGIATMGRFALDNDRATTIEVENKVGQVQRHRRAIARRNGFTDCAAV